MKRTFAVGTFAVGALVAGLSLGPPAFAESLMEKTGVNEMLGVSPSTSDFVTEAAIGGMFEIQSSEIAKQKASPTEQSFAERMIEDHMKASNELEVSRPKRVRASGSSHGAGWIDTEKARSAEETKRS
jgi:predicted outer membrane protein